MSCTSFSEFLVYVSPQVAALLSATALWVASRARSTSKDARATSRAALATSKQAYAGPHVVVHPDVLEALRKPSYTTQAPGPTSTSLGDEDDGSSNASRR